MNQKIFSKGVFLVILLFIVTTIVPVSAEAAYFDFDHVWQNIRANSRTFNQTASVYGDVKNFFSNIVNQINVFLLPPATENVVVDNNDLNKNALDNLREQLKKEIDTQVDQIKKSGLSTDKQLPRIIQNILPTQTERVIVERQIVTQLPTSIEENLKNIYSKKDVDGIVSNINRNTSSQVTNVYQTIAATNNIDQLTNTVLNNPTISSGTLSGTITSSAALSVSNLTVTDTATSTFSAGIQTTALNVTSTSATSTFANGIELSAGCFSANGNCIVSGSGSGSISGAGSSAQITFWSGTTAVTGSNSLVWNSTNSRLGIGTTTPSKNLSVHGDTLISGDVTAANIIATGTATVSGNTSLQQATSTYLAVTTYASTTALTVSNNATIGGTLSLPNTPLAASSGGTGQDTSASTGIAVINSGTWSASSTLAAYRGGTGWSTINSGYLLFGNGADRLATSSSLYFDTANGRLGIGTTSPNTLLQLAGAIRPQLLLSDTAGGVDAKHAYASSTAGAWSWGTLNDALSTFTERMRLTTGGSLGMGTTSPYGLFSVEQGTEAASLWVGNQGSSTPSLMVTGVNGNGHVGIGAIPTADYKLQISDTVNSGLTTNIENLSNGASAYSSILMSNDAGNNVSVMVNSSGKTDEAGANSATIRTDGAGAGNLFLGAGGLASPNGLTVHTSSRIGIGTSTPQWLLNLASSTASQLSLSAGAGVGQWAFRNAGGNLYFATTTVAGTATTTTSALTIIGSSGRVGIGTTNPSYTLDINGSMALGNNGVVTGRNSVGGDTAILNTASDEVTVGWTFNGGLTLQAGNSDATGNFIAFKTQGSERARIDSAGLFGIGTTSPYSLLAISNSRSTAANTPLFTIASTTNGTATSTLFTIRADGLVGIGTTSPYAKLSVVGQTVAAYFTATTSTTSTFPYASTTALTVSGTSGLALSGLGQGWLHTAGGTNAITASTSPTINYITATSTTATSTFASGGFVVNTSKFVVQQNSGKVGIGTSTPSDLLHLWNSPVNTTAASRYPSNHAVLTIEGSLSTGGGAPGLGLLGRGDAPTDNLGYIDLAAEDGSTGNIDRWVIGRYPYQGRFYIAETTNLNNPHVGQTERLTIANGGNIGIGTSTPNQALTIFRDGADAAIEFSTISGANEKWTIGIDDSDAAKFKISSSTALGTNDRFVIDGNGLVGIGTTSPYAKLSVVGQTVAAYFTATTSTASTFPYASTTALTVSGTASTTNLTVSAMTSGSLLFAGTAGALTQDNSNLFWDDSNNRLGIGTTTPYAKLQITGNARPQLMLSSQSADVDQKHWYASTTDSGALAFGTWNDDLGNESYSERFRMTANGFFGINNTDPAGNTLIISQVATTTGNPTVLYVQGAPHTTLDGANETMDVNFAFNRAVQFTASTTQVLSTQRAFGIFAPTYSFSSAATSTITDAVTTYISGPPIIGTKATSTNTYGLFIDGPNVRGTGAIAPEFGYGALIAAPSGAVNNFAAQFNGKIGVNGTTSPNYGLTVDGNMVIGTTTTHGGFDNVLAGTAFGFYGNGSGYGFGVYNTDPNSTGDIAKFGTAGAVNINENDLVVITNSGKVGISSTSPWGMLSITNTTAAPSLLVEDSANPDNSPFIVDTSGNVRVMSTNKLIFGSTYPTQDDYQSISGNGDGNDLTFRTYQDYIFNAQPPASGDAGTTVVTIKQQGNLGIGTSTPNQKLSIFKSADDSAIEFSSLTGNPYKWTIGQDYSDAGKFKISSSTALGTNDRFVIDGSGRVGIGTTSPYAPLSVVGQTVAAYFTATTSTASTFPYASTTALTVSGASGLALSGLGQGWLHTAGGTNAITASTSPTVAYLVATGTTASILPYASTTALTSSGSAYLATSGGSVGIGTTSPWGLFSINPNGITGPSFVVGSSTATKFIVANSGNVGIGTTSPYAPLSVVGQTVAAYFTATTSTTSTFPYASTTALTVSGTASTTNLTVSAMTSGSLLFAGTAGALTQDNSNLFWDDSNNRLGIGTTTPGYPLHVKYDNSGYSYLTIENAGTPGVGAGEGILFLEGSVDGGNTAGYIRFERDGTGQMTMGPSGPAPIVFVNGSTEHMRISNTGLVGIGTTTPTWLLNPASTTAAQLALSAGAGVNQWAFRNAGGNLYLATTTVAGNATTTLAALTILGSNGNVGISSSTPSAKLSLSGGNFFHSASGNPSNASAIVLGPAGNSNLTHSAIQGDYLYYTVGGGLFVVDISTPTAPSIVNASTIAGAGSVVVSGRYAYVGGLGSQGIKVYDISIPTTPALVSTTAFTSTIRQMYISGKYLHIAGTNDYYIYDISNPYLPKLVYNAGGTDTGIGVYVYGRYAYVVANDGSAKLRVFDVSDPAAASVVATLPLGTTAANSVYSNGKYTYVTSGTDGLHIIDTKNPTSPVELATTTSGISNAVDVVVQDNYAYVADSIKGLVVLDVSSTSTAPTLIGTYATTTANAVVRGVTLSGKYAYLSYGTAASTAGIEVVDLNGVRTPTINTGALFAGSLNTNNNVSIGNNLYVASGITAGLGGIYSNGPLSIMATSSGVLTSPNILMGNTAIGTTTSYAKLSVWGGGTGTGQAFGITDNASTTRFLVLDNGTVGIGTSTPWGLLSVNPNALGAGVPSFVVGSSTATNFVITNGGNVGIGTTTPASKLALVGGNFMHKASGNPTKVGSVTYSTASSTVVSGRYAFVADGSNIRVVDVATSTQPVEVASLALSDEAHGLALAGNYLYVANLGQGLTAVDVSNPASPIKISSVATVGNAEDVSVSGKYAYVADGGNFNVIDISHPYSMQKVFSGGIDTGMGVYVFGRFAFVTALDGTAELRVYDIEKPTAPVEQPGINLAAAGQDVVVAGRYAFVAIGASGVSVVDLTDFSVDATYNTDGFAYSLFLAGNYLYVADGTNGMVVLDVTAPTAPTLVGTVATAGNVFDVYVQGKYAYLASNSAGLEIIDINGTETPSMNVGSLLAGSFSTLNDGNIANNLNVGNTINVGWGGIYSTGPLSVLGTTTPNVFSGSVGIGTTTPIDILHVAHDSDPTIMIENTDSSLTTDQLIGAVDWYSADPSGAGVGVLGGMRLLSTDSTGTNKYFSILTPSSASKAVERMRIEGDGSFLAFASSTLLNATAKDAGLSASIGTSLYMHAGANAAQGTSTLVIAGDVGTGATIKNSVAQLMFYDNSGDHNFNIRYTDQGATDTGVDDRLIISKGTNGQNTSDYFTIDGGNGNVGIGTTSPSAKLEILDGGTTATQLLKITGDDDSPYGLVIGNNTFSADAATGLSIYTSNAGKAFLDARGTGATMGLAVQGSEKLSITNGGNVGIGTTTPDEKLTVTVTGVNNATVSTTNLNGIKIEGTTTDGSYENNGLIITTPTGESAFFAGHKTASNNMDLVLGANDTERLRVTGAGLVGIGTTSPDSLLHIWDNDTGAVLSIETQDTANTSFAGIEFAHGTGGGTVPAVIAVEGTNKKLYFGIGSNLGVASADDLNVNALTLVSGGNVGMGSTSPWAKFSLQGLTTDGSVTNPLFAIASSSVSATTTLFVVTRAGDVGIGTTTPGAKLNVIGALCVDDSTPTCGNSARTDGTIYSVAVLSNTLDLAESYPTKDTTLIAGELVALDLSNSVYIKRSDKFDTPIGIISTKPGFYLGGFNDELYNDETRLPVALSGRVPVKVNLEGGEIKIGDKLTISSTPGVGMKARGVVQTVGIALENYSGSRENENGTLVYDKDGSGEILVFVNLGWNKLSQEVSGGTVTSPDRASGGIWGIDETNGTIKPLVTGALDLDGKDINNIGSLLSKSGKWGLSYEGGLVVESLEVKGSIKIGSPSKPIGITLFDEKTGEPYCLKISAGIVLSASGECGQAQESETSGQEENSTSNETPDMSVETTTVSEIIEEATTTEPTSPSEPAPSEQTPPAETPDETPSETVEPLAE